MTDGFCNCNQCEESNTSLVVDVTVSEVHCPKETRQVRFQHFFDPAEIIRDKSNNASTDLLPGIASRKEGIPPTTRRKEDNCAK